MAAMAAMMLMTIIVERMSTFIFWIIAGIDGLKNLAEVLAEVFHVELTLEQSPASRVYQRIMIKGN
jgi:hypothetical protein